MSTVYAGRPGPDTSASGAGAQIRYFERGNFLCCSSKPVQHGRVGGAIVASLGLLFLPSGMGDNPKKYQSAFESLAAPGAFVWTGKANQ